MLKLRPMGLAAILSLVLPLGRVIPTAAAVGESELREKMLGIYVHGVDDQLAHQVVRAEELPELRRLLTDPGFPRRDNLVAFLMFRDGQEAVAPLLAFLQNPPAPVTVPEEDRALLLAPRALGLIARRGSRAALDALLAMTGPAPGVLAGAAARAPNPESLLADLQERALRGLAISASPQGRARLLSVAHGETVLAPSRRDLKPFAEKMVALFDEGGVPARPAPPLKAGPRVDGALPGAPRIAANPAGPDGPLTPDTADQQAFSHRIPMTWANHAALLDVVTEGRARDLLRAASLRAARADYPDDVSCCVEVTSSGAVHTFGTVDDGMDTIDTTEELFTVFNDPIARAKVVRENQCCYDCATNGNVIGCALLPGHGFVVVRLSSASAEGGVWIHEFGHNVGLQHSADFRSIMGSGGGRLLSQDECDAFHSAGTVVGACGDPDDDLVGGVADNCPNASNAGQVDQDGDLVGDSCDPCPLDAQDDGDGDGYCANLDNCPGLANPGQEDGDSDTIGDVCDVCPFDGLNDGDGDQLCYPADNCPAIFNPGQQNSDGDSRGDACDLCPFAVQDDEDLDGLCFDVDNCQYLANPDQADQDGDGIGDACDPDLDGDGTNEVSDNCPGIANPGQPNSDGDSQGDACDPCPFDAQNDGDADGYCANVDNCPALANPDQTDWDSDGIGNPCDLDIEGDAFANTVDNCPNDANPLQEDRNRNGIGNACDQIRTVAHTGPAQYGTIQAAIHAASAGDVVVVAPGTYHENLMMKAGVDVVGPGPALATVDGAGAVDVPIVRMVDLATGARFSGFKVTGALLGTELFGGGIQVLRSDAEVDGNLITGNRATLGGGLYIEGDPGSPTTFAPIITNNVIAGNDVSSYSGALMAYYGGPGWKIRHNTVANNTSDTGVGGITLVGCGGIEFSNNVVSGNSSVGPTTADGLAVFYSPGLDLHHNDLHGNAHGDYYPPGENPTGTNGNVSVAPGFAAPGSGDYSPGAGSPLIDAGSDLGDPPRDQAGRPRPLEGDGTAPARSDIGALERVVADVDGDGVPNASDRCPYTLDPVQADSDGDGVGDLCDNCAGDSNPNQRDLDRDGLGDLCDNCPVVSNSDQTDSAGYGVGDACALPDADGDSVPDSNDCAPLDHTAYFMPVEVRVLALSGKVVTAVSFSEQDAGSSTAYDVAGGFLGQLRSDHGFVNVSCVSNGQGAPTFADTRPIPASGNGYYYLLRATNACGTGTYGHGRATPDPRIFLDDPGTGPCP